MSRRLKSFYVGWIHGSMEPRIGFLAMKLSLFILAGSLDPFIPGSMHSKMICQRLKSVYFGWIFGSLDPWILRRLVKDFSLSILAGTLDPWILSFIFQKLYLFLLAGSLDPWIL